MNYRVRALSDAHKTELATLWKKTEYMYGHPNFDEGDPLISNRLLVFVKIFAQHKKLIAE